MLHEQHIFCLETTIRPNFKIIYGFVMLHDFLRILFYRKDTMTNAILKEVSKDKLFGSLIRSEQERQVSIIIDRSLEALQEHQQMEPKEISLEDINKVIMKVRKEMATHRKTEN
jgi:hypothetical protein